MHVVLLGDLDDVGVAGIDIGSTLDARLLWESIIHLACQYAGLMRLETVRQIHIQWAHVFLVCQICKQTSFIWQHQFERLCNSESELCSLLEMFVSSLVIPCGCQEGIWIHFVNRQELRARVSSRLDRSKSLHI